MNQEEFEKCVENLNAEKTALDRQYVKKLQEALILEAECIKKDIQIQKLSSDLALLQSENAKLKEKKVDEEVDGIVPEYCS